MSFDQSQLQDAQKLTADGTVDLFEVRLRSNVVFRFNNSKTVSWRGNTYEGLPCQLSGDTRSADEEESRPTLSIANPEGIFTKAAFDGLIENATVRRYRLLRTHMEANMDIHVPRLWYVSRIAQLVRGKMLALELRSMTDGPNFQLPVRQFLYPEFPLVSI